MYSGQEHHKLSIIAEDRLNRPSKLEGNPLFTRAKKLETIPFNSILCNLIEFIKKNERKKKEMNKKLNK